MSDEEFEEQQQLDLQGQADPKIILIRIGGQNVTTQVDQSELEPVDVSLTLLLRCTFMYHYCNWYLLFTFFFF